ncbi:MAG: polysaccharide deacetylase family protein [Limisphaerales bacterium]
MPIKSLLASQVHRVALATGFSIRRAKAAQAGRIIMFHGVGDDSYPVQEFEQHLQFFARHFQILSLEAFCDRISSGQKLTSELVLTFDDGLRNNFTSAYPLLRRHKLPATFFVCPALIEQQRWLWNHEARIRLQEMEPDQVQGLIEEFRLKSVSGVEPIVEWMKTLSLKERSRAEQVIRKVNPGFRPSEKQRIRCDMMTWDDLRSMDPELITIGSHTMEHPILSTLEEDILQCELVNSRRLLEDKLNRTVDQFCYPNGAHNAEVVEAVRQHYRIAVTTEPGLVQSDSDLIRLPRIGIVSQPLLSWRMHRHSA